MNAFYLLYELLAALRRKRWSASRLAEYQAVRLREILHHAYDSVPYYRELFDEAGVWLDDIRSLADLGHIPITTKAAMQSVPTEALLASNLDSSAFVKELTSGSTGRPFTTQHTHRERIRKSAIYMRTYLQAGLRLTDRQVCVTEDRGHGGYRHWLRALEDFFTQKRGQEGDRRGLRSLIGGGLNGGYPHDEHHSNSGSAPHHLHIRPPSSRLESSASCRSRHSRSAWYQHILRDCPPCQRTIAT